MMLTADDIPALDARLAPPMDTRQRGFWIAFGCAVLFHAALLVEINRGGMARYAGTAEGSNDAIAVELVTEADLKSRETVALPPPGGGPPPMKPSVQPQPEPTPPPEQAETPPEKAPEPVPPAPEPPAPEPPQPEKQAAVTPPPEPTPPAPETKSAAPAFEPLVPDLAELPPPDTKTEVKPPEEKKPEPAEKHEAQPAEKPVEKQAKPQPPAKKKQQQAKLDLTPPSAMPSVSAVGPGRAAGASRPPGITRSGENDDFGRGVIRALRATMPPPNGVYGRVTVRLLLNNNGDLAEVQVLEPSGKPGLDQNVVFSTKQAYFPLPPAGATVPDRTFFITYVYR
jgi:TonB family protein